ncbi:MAG: AsmA family protein [Gammaproteobacteria bacterium]|nr:AsmA family protein [Gammaproteobacteria bacterium]
MKFIKWLLIGIVTLVLVVGIGIAALIYLVDWNDYKDTIQEQTKKHTGRDLTITGDLNPSVFPWAGISIGELSLANAEGFGDTPFAKIGSADVKVELLPLLRKEVNVKTVQLHGLQLDLQVDESGVSNWDDLVQGESTTTTETEEGATAEVEGNSATIAALAVGGVEIKDAAVSWLDKQAGLDAKLEKFNLNTGAIELQQPFDFTTEFTVASNSMDLSADMNSGGTLLIDLENGAYTLTGFTLEADAKGSALPNQALKAKIAADVNTDMGAQTITVDKLVLDALGLSLSGNVAVNNFIDAAAVTGQLASNEFSPREMMETLGIAAPETADPDVLSKAKLSLALDATTGSANLNELTIALDDTTFTGSASVPSFAGAVPPVRFDFNLDAIDVDRYLPPVTEGEEVTQTDAPSESTTTGDEPIELPNDLIRGLDIEGRFAAGSVKVSNLTTTDIVIPVNAKGGKVSLDDVTAQLYSGQINATAGLDASSDAAAYAANFSLAGIEAEPLLIDLLQKEKSFLSGKGNVALDLTTGGNSVNAIKAALNGAFNTDFTDGSINGVNLGYQIRRAKAALTGGELSAEEPNQKTDFSSLAVSGTFTNGVMTSDDLDMRSPLLRVGGAGQVDLPQENVDYTLTTLVTGTSEGQGGKDLEALKGVKLEIPIRGTFDELAANFAGVILKGMKDNITSNLKGQAEAAARAEAEKLKAQAEAELNAKKAEAEAALEAKKAEAQQKLEAEKAKAAEALEEQKSKAKDQVKDKLKSLF